MEALAQYDDWCKQVTPVYASLHSLVRALPWINVKLRKCILTFCRVQPPDLHPDSYYYKQFEPELFYPLNLPVWEGNTDKQQMINLNLYKLLSQLPGPSFCPVTAGILAAATVYAPYKSYLEVEEVRLETIRKEINAAESHNPVTFNYTPWLSTDDVFRQSLLPSSVPTHPLMPTDSRIARAIQRQFSVAKSRLWGTTLFPKIGVKTFGEVARARIQLDLKSILPCLNGTDPWIPFEPETIEDLERIYCYFGTQSTGPTEMRSAWRYNDLKPRVYYAQGPSAYHSSKYVQGVFNTIVDCFPATERYRRHELPFGSKMPTAVTLAIYDYSSFTSKLTEVTRFIYALADFLDGVPVYIVDTHVGKYEVNLGDLLRDYALVANVFPEVDLGPLLDTDVELLLYHSTGMLGVPGNITSCTLLHGLHLATIVGDLYSCKCVGDDAMALLEIEVEDQLEWIGFLDQLALLGDCNEDKTVSWKFGDESTTELRKHWHYKKRPITVIVNSIFQGDLVILPSLELILGLKDNYHKQSKSMSWLPNRWKTIMRQIARLHATLWNKCIPISDIGRTLLVRFIKTAYRVSGIAKMIYATKQKHRYLIKYRGVALGNYNPSLTEDMVDLPIFMQRRQVGSGRKVEVPIPIEYVQEGSEVRGYAGETGETSMTKGMSLMKSLGFVHLKKKVHVTHLDIYTDAALLELIETGQFSYPPTYEYEVVRDFPQWYYSS